MKKFNTKVCHRVSKMFKDTRIARQRSEWIGENVWKRLLAHWNSPMYCDECLTT